jgi:hypothetical protein
MFDYANTSPETLWQRVPHLTRRERDVQERLTAWENQVPQLGEDIPDPVRKRLAFLLLKQRRHRLAAEKVEASRWGTPLVPLAHAF